MQSPLDNIILVAQMYKIVFRLVTLSRGAVFGYFLPIWKWLLRTIQLLHLNFLDIRGTAHRVLSLKKYFHIISPLLGVIFRYFWAHFEVCSYYLRAASSNFMKFCVFTFFFYYFDSHCAKKNFTACIPLLGGILQCFGPISSIFFHVLRNLKHFLYILSSLSSVSLIFS